MEEAEGNERDVIGLFSEAGESGPRFYPCGENDGSSLNGSLNERKVRF